MAQLPSLEHLALQPCNANRVTFPVHLPAFPGSLITFTRGDTLPDHKKHFARDDGTPDMKVSLKAAGCEGLRTQLASCAR